MFIFSLPTCTERLVRNNDYIWVKAERESEKARVQEGNKSLERQSISNVSNYSIDRNQAGSLFLCWLPCEAERLVTESKIAGLVVLFMDVHLFCENHSTYEG